MVTWLPLLFAVNAMLPKNVVDSNLGFNVSNWREQFVLLYVCAYKSFSFTNIAGEDEKIFL